MAHVVGNCAQERQEAMGKIKRAAQKSEPRTTDKTVKPHEQAFEKIYRFVLKIPRGRVMTYGQIARLLEDRYSPRLVGWAMHATPQDGRNIPWHRVINSKGGISTGRIIIQEPQLQQYLLEAEGVIFDERGHCNLSVYQWSPTARKKTSVRDGKPTSKGSAKIAKGSKTKKVKER